MLMALATRLRMSSSWCSTFHSQRGSCLAARRPWHARSRASPWGGRTDRTAGGSRDRRGPGPAPGARGRPPPVSARPAPAGGGQHPLAAGVVGPVEALGRSPRVAVAGDGDAERLAPDPAVEAPDRAVGARRAGPGLAVPDAELPAGLLEAVGREAAAAVGRRARDPEREGGRHLPRERGGAGLGPVALDRRVHG